MFTEASTNGERAAPASEKRRRDASGAAAQGSARVALHERAPRASSLWVQRFLSVHAQEECPDALVEAHFMHAVHTDLKRAAAAGAAGAAGTIGASERRGAASTAVPREKPTLQRHRLQPRGLSSEELRQRPDETGSQWTARLRLDGATAVAAVAGGRGAVVVEWSAGDLPRLRGLVSRAYRRTHVLSAKTVAAFCEALRALDGAPRARRVALRAPNAAPKRHRRCAFAGEALCPVHRDGSCGGPNDIVAASNTRSPAVPAKRALRTARAAAAAATTNN